MKQRPKIGSCLRPTTSWRRSASSHTTETAAAARCACISLALCCLAAQAAGAGYTTHSIDERELAEKQGYAIEFAQFAGSIADGVDNAFSLQLWIGDKGGESDIFGGGIGLRYDRRISGRWSAGLSGGNMSSTVGAWWIGAQGEGHFEVPGGWQLNAQIALADQEAEGDFGLSCQDAFGGYAIHAVGSLRYFHVYEHLLFAKETGPVQWLLDVGFLSSFVDLQEGRSAFASAGPCEDEPVDSVHQLTLGAGLGVRLGAVQVIAGLRKGSLGLQSGVGR